MPDRTGKLGAEAIEQFIQDNPGVEVDLLGHSQGGAVTTSIGMYLAGSAQDDVGLWTFGSAANPGFGWKYEVHQMNVLDPVPHIAGRGLLLFPVAALDLLRPNVRQVWYWKDQHGVGGLWYHSWYPSYMGKPVTRDQLRR
jgi:hypothetical protein